MTGFIIRRIIILAPLLVLLSIITFIVIELPPGDYLTTYIIQLESRTQSTVSEAEIARLTQQYGLDRPVYVRYFIWMRNIVLHGDFGRSFGWDQPVVEVIGDRLVLTIMLSLGTLLFTWIIAVPVGIYSATHQYSFLDHSFTFLGFVGLATPNFLLALVLMWLSFAYFDFPVTGLFSQEYMDAGWSIGKVVDMLKHIWVTVIVVGTAGTAGIIRVMRGCLLDELRKQYVVTARAKGVAERRLLFRYPVRLAVNPLVSTIGWLLPGIISGMTITAIVLNLPTTGPVLLRALMSQDMYLAGSFLLILSALTIIGTLISDVLLAWLDPRIRYGGISE